MNTNKLLSILASFALACSLAQAGPLSTEFTYQGRLNGAGGGVTGLFDFKFALYDALASGNPVGLALTNPAVPVSNGVFTVILNYGTNVFDGNARFLEIGVRTNVAPNAFLSPMFAGGPFITLAPRQPVHPTPYAQYAASAGFATTLAPDSVSSGSIQNQSITAADLAAGQVVTSLNGLRDAVTLQAGASIGLFKNGNTLQISAVTNIAGGSFWGVSGNSGTAAGVNFLGTTDNQPVEIKVNNTRALRLEPTAGGGVNVIAGSPNNVMAPGIVGATIGGGDRNTIQIQGSSATIGGGLANTADARCATIPGGHSAAATHYGQWAYASGAFANAGDAQTSVLIVRNETANATPAELFLDGSGQRLTIPRGSAWAFDILVIGRSQEGGEFNLASKAAYQIRGLIDSDGSGVHVGGKTVTLIFESGPAFNADVDSNPTSAALVVRVTGLSSTRVRWVATVRLTEVSFP